MRISTPYLLEKNLSSILNQQAALAKTQQQLSTGKRIINPSDDPAGSVTLLNLKREQAVTEQYLVNAGKAESKLSIEEGSLSGATDILQRVRELSVQALNGTNAGSDRKVIAIEIRELNKQLLNIANTRDANDEYLFSGFKSTVQPYDNVNSDYQGDGGVRNLRVGAGVLLATNDPGNHLFESRHVATTISKAVSGGGSTGNVLLTETGGGKAELTTPLTFTYDGASSSYQVSDGINTATIPYTAGSDGKRVDLSTLNPDLPNISIQLTGTPVDADQFIASSTVTEQSVFKTIDQFATALENNQVSSNDGPNNGEFLTNVSSSLDKIVDGQARIGSRLNAIDQQRGINENISFNKQKSMSEIEDLDYAEAISLFTLQQTGLQAAQQSFVKIQGLSLFNYL